MKFIVALVLLVATNSRAAELTDYQIFLSNLHYEYSCDLKKFLKDKSLEYPTMDMKTFFELDNVPTNVEFNKLLSVYIPRVVFDGIKKIYKLNPQYSINVLRNILATPIEFKCTNHDSSTGVGIAHAEFIGGRKIDLGIITLILLRALKFPDDLQFANRMVFHETLHHVGGIKGSILFHDGNVLETGGIFDTVYSCSNFAYGGPGFKKGDINDKYFLYFKNNAIVLEDLQTRLNYPWRNILHRFNFDQCMRCALTYIDGDRVMTRPLPLDNEKSTEYQACKNFPKFEEKDVVHSAEKKRQLLQDIFELQQKTDQYKN